MALISSRIFHSYLGGIALFLLFFAASPNTWAHARLIRSEPAKDSIVFPAPGQLSLSFNELLEDGFNVVTIFPASELTAKKRSDLVRGKPHLDPSDGTRLIVKLAPLAPGDYVVEWRVLSRDGHSAPGRFTFRVRAR
jgi:methionine-rich copper-binding protein CopC